VIDRLVAARVESYHVDYRSGRTTYYLPEGITLDFGFERPPEAIAEAFDAEAVRAAGLIVFIDESGLSERPTRVRTWAPKGCTPVVQFHFNWKHVSANAGMIRTNLLLRSATATN